MKDTGVSQALIRIKKRKQEYLDILLKIMEKTVNV